MIKVTRKEISKPTFIYLFFLSRPAESANAPLIEEFDGEAAPDDKELRKQLCPYAAVGECRYGLNCVYLHGDVCDMCGLQVLHPTDNDQRSDHTKVSIMGLDIEPWGTPY